MIEKCPLCNGTGEIAIAMALSSELGREALALALIKASKRRKIESPLNSISITDTTILECPLCEGSGAINRADLISQGISSLTKSSEIIEPFIQETSK